MLTNRFAAAAAALLISSAIVAPASAATITYTFTGVFDGTLNGQAFSNTQATFTGIGDTDDVYFQQDANFVPLSSLVAVSGGTTFDFGSGFNFWSSQSFGTSGFKTGDDFIAFTGLGSYANPSNLATTPVSVYYYATSPFATSQGGVVISNATGTTFAASISGAVPEPATWALFILGFGLVGGAMRRRSAMVKASRTRLTYA